MSKKIYGASVGTPIKPEVIIKNAGYEFDYSVKKALSDCKLEGDYAWTEEEQARARKTLGIIDGDEVAY